MDRPAPRPPSGPRSVVVCPDKFRGSMSAATAAATLAEPFRAIGAHVTELPLSDGGEGFLEIVGAGAATSGLGDPTGGELRSTAVEGPWGTAVEVPWVLTGDGTAVVEAALACGHPASGGAVADPVAASSVGLGQVLVAAREAGARRAVVGIGGTVTTDGGLGALDALGWSAGGLDLVVAVDTRVRFLDAATVYAPQKGASPAQVEVLDRRLHRTAETLHARTGCDVTGVDGTGAGGGLAGALVALGGVLRPGVEVVAEACGLVRHLEGADVVVTGEGRLDSTSLTGKAVGWVLERSVGSRRVVVVGDAAPEVLALLDPDVVVAVLRHGARDDHDSMVRAADLARAAAARLAAGLVPDLIPTDPNAADRPAPAGLRP